MTKPSGELKLIFEATGSEVVVGALCVVNDRACIVEYFRPPHKPSSQGKVTVRPVGSLSEHASEYYVSVIGAKWVNRTDQSPAKVEETNEATQVQIIDKVMQKHIDINGPEMVEVVYNDQTQTLWVNVNGVCALRASNVGMFTSDIPEGL